MHTLSKRFLFARLLRDAANPDGGAGGGDAGATPSADSGAPATPSADSQTPTPAWHDSIQDEGLRQFIAGKGFKDASEAAKALQDMEGKTAVPESPDAYALPVPEGQDKAFASEAAKWMHEAGIPVAQAQALATKWNEYAATQQQAADQARQQQDEADMTALKKEWGPQHDANIELGRRAVRAFVGQGDEAAGLLDKIETAIGAAETIKLFHRIGKHLGEGSLTPEGGSGGSSVPADPEAARAARMFPSMNQSK